MSNDCQCVWFCTVRPLLATPGASVVPSAVCRQFSTICRRNPTDLFDTTSPGTVYYLLHVDETPDPDFPSCVRDGTAVQLESWTTANCRQLMAVHRRSISQIRLQQLTTFWAPRHLNSCRNRSPAPHRRPNSESVLSRAVADETQSMNRVTKVRYHFVNSGSASN